MTKIMFGRLSAEQRLQIQCLRLKGHSIRDIATKVACSPSTVVLWCSKKIGSVNDAKRTRRKQKVDQRKKRRIVHKILTQKTSLRKLAVENNVSPNTIQRIIKTHSPEDPIKPYKKRKIPKLTPKQKKIRYFIIIILFTT